ETPALEKGARFQPLRHVKRAAEVLLPHFRGCDFIRKETKRPPSAVAGSYHSWFKCSDHHHYFQTHTLLAILKVAQFAQSSARYRWIYLRHCLRNFLPYKNSTCDL
ncbi:hypothetical protein EMPG_15609, partial [Blastomyces silverae]